MNRKFQFMAAYLSGALMLASGYARAGDEPAPASTTTPDVTITVIPSGQDVINTVVHNITVPAAVGVHKPGPPPTSGNHTSEFGKQTAQAAQQIEETKEAQQAMQHEANLSQQMQAPVQQAQQQAEQAAANEAQQAQQAQQQAQTLSHQQPQPPPPPSPPGPPWE